MARRRRAMVMTSLHRKRRLKRNFTVTHVQDALFSRYTFGIPYFFVLFPNIYLVFMYTLWETQYLYHWFRHFESDKMLITHGFLIRGGRKRVNHMLGMGDMKIPPSGVEIAVRTEAPFYLASQKNDIPRFFMT